MQENNIIYRPLTIDDRFESFQLFSELLDESPTLPAGLKQQEFDKAFEVATNSRQLFTYGGFAGTRLAGLICSEICDIAMMGWVVCTNRVFYIRKEFRGGISLPLTLLKTQQRWATERGVHLNSISIMSGINDSDRWKPLLNRAGFPNTFITYTT